MPFSWSVKRHAGLIRRGAGVSTVGFAYPWATRRATMSDTVKTRLAGLVLAALVLASCGGADKSGGELLYEDDPFYDFDEPIMEEGD
jgi:hypothetical protein